MPNVAIQIKPKRKCRSCGADISKRHGKTIYCINCFFYKKRERRNSRLLHIVPIFFALIFLSGVAHADILNSKVTNIDFNSATLYVNNTYSVIVTIQNDSNTSINTILHLTDSDHEFFSFAYTISSQADINAIIPWTPSIIGLQTVKASIDLNDDNPLDNNFSRDVFIRKGTDLAVTGLFINGVVVAGTTARASVFFQNQGDQTSAFFTLNVYLDDSNVLFSQLLNPLNQDEFGHIDVNFLASNIGSHALKAVLDENNLIREFSETNNLQQVSFTVQAFPDQNLTREQILDIIRQFFEQQVTNDRVALQSCMQLNQQLDNNNQIANQNYQSCNDQRNAYSGSLAICQNSLTNCTLETTKVQNDARTLCETQYSAQLSSDQNLFNTKISQKDFEVQQAKELTNQKESLTIVLAGLIMVVLISVSLLFVKGKISL